MKKELKKMKTNIEVEVTNEHERIVKLLAKAKPGSAEYAKLLGELKEYEDIQRKKDELKNSDKDSKRKHIGTALIGAGSSITISKMWFKIEKELPVNGKCVTNFIQSVFRK